MVNVEKNDLKFQIYYYYITFWQNILVLCSPKVRDQVQIFTYNFLPILFQNVYSQEVLDGQLRSSL